MSSLSGYQAILKSKAVAEMFERARSAGNIKNLTKQMLTKAMDEGVHVDKILVDGRIQYGYGVPCPTTEIESASIAKKVVK